MTYSAPPSVPEGAIYLVSDKLQRVTAIEIQVAEETLGALLPSAYVAFITRLGPGICDGYLWISDPSSIAADSASTREIFTHYAHFWREGAGVLSQEHVRGVIAIGHTIDGDYLTYHPQIPEQVYILPRHDERIYPVGPRLEDAWGWLSNSGVLVEPVQRWEYVADAWQLAPTFYSFEPTRDRAGAQYQLLAPPRRLDAILDRLTTLARSGDAARLIRYGEDDPTGDPAVQQLFLPHARAAVHCQGYDDGAVQITISYDPTERHPTVDLLVSFLVQLGARDTALS